MTFDKVLTLPFKNDGIVKLLIGGVLQLIPIINFFSMGYVVECYEKGALRREEMPEWTDWGNKFVNGLLIFVISFVYLLIPILLFGSSLVSMVTNPWYGISGGMMLLGIIVFLVFAFSLPMAIANFAAKKNFAAAFEFGYIFKLIGSSLGSYIGAFLLYIVAAIICMIIAMIPVIGWIAIIFIGFYLGCVAGFLFGSVYGKAGGAAFAGGNPVSGAVVETAAALERSFCSDCGESLQPQAKFCPKCGSRQ
ncbi:MAG: DUF4013 domain-containing protein [Desulfotomaculaceae bacterium]|nr:DUF4013 domain-containing protein [Desulfotomaculaceae bacterium]